MLRAPLAHSTTLPVDVTLLYREKKNFTNQRSGTTVVSRAPVKCDNHSDPSTATYSHEDTVCTYDY